jgi:hypothetical protein
MKSSILIIVVLKLAHLTASAQADSSISINGLEELWKIALQNNV